MHWSVLFITIFCVKNEVPVKAMAHGQVTLPSPWLWRLWVSENPGLVVFTIKIAASSGCFIPPKMVYCKLHISWHPPFSLWKIIHPQVPNHRFHLPLFLVPLGDSEIGGWPFFPRNEGHDSCHDHKMGIFWAHVQTPKDLANGPTNHQVTIKTCSKPSCAPVSIVGINTNARRAQTNQEEIQQEPASTRLCETKKRTVGYNLGDLFGISTVNCICEIGIRLPKIMGVCKQTSNPVNPK